MSAGRRKRKRVGSFDRVRYGDCHHRYTCSINDAIVLDSAPIVKAIGDGVVTLQERSLFHPQVQIDFQGGQLYLIVSQNGKAFQQTSVDGVYGTKDVLLSPIRVDVKMNGRLSIIAFMDGLRFIYDIFRLIVVNQTATAAFSPPPSSPSSCKLL